MDNFPKKYDYKKNKQTTCTTNWKKIESPFIPMDQKLNPWVIFSNYYKDLFLLWNKLLWNEYYIDTWLGLSSQYYSNISKWKPNTWTDKLIDKNIKFIDKLWFFQTHTTKDQLLTEEFNIYIKNIFSEIYEKKILVKKETTLRSKDLQTNISPTDIIKTEKDTIEYTIKYFVESKWLAISVATTNLSTIFGDVALAVNPMDKRYKKLVWQNVIIPIINKCIPIITDSSIDMFQWTWVQRITPWHDSRSLKVAQTHDLPTDVYAIDTDGTFSENAWMFAWKSLEDFSENIEKYIDDIWNLTSKKIVKWFEYTNKHTWEILYPMTLAQWNISYDYAIDFLHELFENNDIQIDAEKKEYIWTLLDTKKEVNISNKSWLWLLIPVCYDENWNWYPLCDEIICKKYLEQKSKKDIVLTLIISNLITENHLPNEFSIDMLIDALYKKSFLWDSIKIKKYIEIYEWKAQDNSVYKNWLKHLKSLISDFDKSIENVEWLQNLLIDSFAIKSEWDLFSIDYSQIFQSELPLYLQTNDSFNKSFIDTIWFIYKNNLKSNDISYNEIFSLDQTFISDNDDIDLLLDSLLFGLDYSKTILFSNIIFHYEMVDFKWNKITNFNSKYLSQDLYENFQIYGPDVLRMTLLLWKFHEPGKVIFDTYPMREYDMLLNKIRNANRYVFSKFVSPWETIKISKLLDWIDREISDCDIRLLHHIKSLLDEINYQLQNKKYLELWHIIFGFYKTILCEKYLTSTKVSFSTNTPNVILLAFAILNKLIEPYVPSFANALQSKLIFEWDGLKVFDLSSIYLSDRNYKLNIFMDIIDKLVELKNTWNIAQHENIDIFIQANPDFLDFIQDNDLLIRSLIKVWDIQYIWTNIDIPNWYDLWNVININLWMKKSSKDIVTEKDLLKALQQEREDKNTYIWHLKWLLASAYATCPPDVLAHKKEKIRELQAELDDLEYKIGLLKTK